MPPDAEARRLLAADGVAAVVAPEPLDTPFMRGLRALLVSANPKARSRLHRSSAPGSSWCSPPVRDVPARRSGSSGSSSEPTALRRVVRSLSYGGPALGPAQLHRLLDDVDALGEREGREWARVLRLSWLRRGRRSRPTRTRPPRP